MLTDGYARALAQALTAVEQQTLTTGHATPVLFGLFDRPASGGDRMLEADPMPLPTATWRSEQHRSPATALVTVVEMLNATGAPDWLAAWLNRPNRDLVGYAFLAQAPGPFGGNVMRWLRARDADGRYYSIQRIHRRGPATITVQQASGRLALASPVAVALARLVEADPC